MTFRGQCLLCRRAGRHGPTASSTATVSGKPYNYDYFGYLMPSWGDAGTPSDTILGTVLRSDPVTRPTPR